MTVGIPEEPTELNMQSVFVRLRRVQWRETRVVICNNVAMKIEEDRVGILFEDCFDAAYDQPLASMLTVIPRRRLDTSLTVFNAGSPVSHVAYSRRADHGL